MKENVINHLFCVLAGAGLQEEVVCLNLRQPLLRGSALREYHFQFVCAVEREACALLRGTGNPVDTVRQRMGAVGLYADRHARVV